MAFLDNSGDIILDAVLTDAGRQRMARGNFKITKFAFGDEEINYGSFNSTHPSGSAFYDLDVMQTPILEAFTNNTSLMKSKLITMSRNNILYMPTFKLSNNSVTKTQLYSDSSYSGGYVLCADLNTEQDGGNVRIGTFDAGVLRGVGSSIEGDGSDHIAIDQGIDSSENGLSLKHRLSDDLVETAFLLRCDHRLIQLHQITDNASKTKALVNQFVDDDGIASYYVALGDGTTCVEAPPSGLGARGVLNRRGPNGDGRGAIIDYQNDVTAADIGEAFAGPLGSILRIYPRSSMHVRQSSSLFDELGSTSTATITLKAGSTITSYKFIDTLINIVGVTTGYSLDIPIRIIRSTES
jgi:hypothetical protein